jgi:hypothetical protein
VAGLVAGPAGDSGLDGADGANAYDLAVAGGFVGTQAQWLASLQGPAGDAGLDGADGPSAYDLAVAGGFVGTQAQWLTSLQGPAGDAGLDGADGANAYDLAVAGGFVGTQAQWLTSLQGPAGDAGLDGADGASAYDLAVAGGFVGTEAQWLASLQGPAGETDPALATEIADARAGFVSLGNRIRTLSYLTSPLSGRIVPGRWYDNAFHAGTGATLTGAANRIEMTPFFTAKTFSIDRMGVAVATAAAGVVGRCFVYGEDADGWPAELIFEAPDDLDMSTTGMKSHVVALTFEAERPYWLGIRRSGTASIIGINAVSLLSFGLAAADGSGTAYANVIRSALAMELHCRIRGPSCRANLSEVQAHRSE